MSLHSLLTLNSFISLIFLKSTGHLLVEHSLYWVCLMLPYNSFQATWWDYIYDVFSSIKNDLKHMQFPILIFFCTMHQSSMRAGWVFQKSRKKYCPVARSAASNNISSYLLLQNKIFFCHFWIHPLTKVMAPHSSLLYAEFLIHTLLLMPTGYPSSREDIKTQSPWHPEKSSEPQECSWYQVILSSLGLCCCLGRDFWSFSCKLSCKLSYAFRSISFIIYIEF